MWIVSRCGAHKSHRLVSNRFAEQDLQFPLKFDSLICAWRSENQNKTLMHMTDEVITFFAIFSDEAIIYELNNRGWSRRTK